jgi:SAM-dependent methyltransferase
VRSVRPDVSLGVARGGFKREWFQRLERLEESSFWFRSRNELIIWMLRRYAPHATTMLEIGCGTGFVLAGIRRALPHLRLTGTELLEEGLAIAARRLPNVDLQRLDATEMSYVDEFDVVGAFDVLEHIEDDVGALHGCGRALRPGGVLLLTVPQHEWLWSPIDVYSQHVRRYRRAELLTKLETAGLAPVRCTSFVSFLLPLMYASRLRQRARRGSFEPEAEYRMSAALDRGFERVATAERRLIQRGAHFPVGGSLLCVAQKPVA